MSKHRTPSTKFLCYVLRHHPEVIGLRLDAQGWADIEELVLQLKRYGRTVTRQAIDRIITADPKGRFALSDDGRRIRANYGHSISVDLGLDDAEPPEYLYHGTSTRFLDDIRDRGLQPMGRVYVHLSETHEAALEVGRRHGPPLVLVVGTGRMHRDGFRFHRAGRATWLTKEIPVKYLVFPDNPE